MPKETVVLCFPIQETHLRQIQDAAGDMEIVVSSQEKIAEDIFVADIFCGHAKVPIDWPRVVKTGRLKWIQSTAVGLDHCLQPPVVRSDIIVSGASGLFADQVAEHGLALLFGILRRLPLFLRAQKNREFARRPTDELQGKTVGIVGFGCNGQRIAELLKPMAGRIVATDYFPDACPDIVDQVLSAAQLHELLAQSDIVVLSLPLTPSTVKLIGDREFEAMKPGSYLINLARGLVVDQDSLIRNLKSGHLAAAGLDVVHPEPLPEESALWELDNVVITPHVAAQSATRISATTDLFCRNMVRYRNGAQLINLADKELGFPRPEHRLS